MISRIDIPLIPTTSNLVCRYISINRYFRIKLEYCFADTNADEKQHPKSGDDLNVY